MFIVDKIINQDGTDYDPPKHPLAEKWKLLYPSCETDVYRCMFCGKCPYGEYWKVPEEDKEAHMKYMMDISRYYAEHGNTFLPKIILKKVNE